MTIRESAVARLRDRATRTYIIPDNPEEVDALLSNRVHREQSVALADQFTVVGITDDKNVVIRNTGGAIFLYSVKTKDYLVQVGN